MIEFDIDREIIRVDEGDVFYIKIKDVTGFISKIDRSIDDFLIKYLTGNDQRWKFRLTDCI